MKEFNLTRQAQNTYSGGMPEPGDGEVNPSKIPQEVNPPIAPKQPGETTRAAELSKDLLRKAWAKSNGYKSFEEIPYAERQTLDYLVEKGRVPIAGGAELPPEEILRFVDTGEGLGFSREDLDDTLRAAGFSAEEISTRSEEEKIETLRGLAGESGGEDPPRNPPPEAGGTGGEEPPDDLPPTEGGSENIEEGGNNNESPREFNLKFEVEDISERSVLNALRAAESSFEFARGDEEKFDTLKDSIKQIRLIPDDHVEGESEEERKRIDRLRGEKTMAESRIRGQIEEWQLSRTVNEGTKPDGQKGRRVERTIPQEWEQGRDFLINAIKAEGDYSTKMDAIEKIIDSLDPNDRSSTGILTAALHEVEGDIELGPIIEDTLEYALEVFLNRADSDPGADYPQFTFVESENMAIITHAGRRFDQARKDAGLELKLDPGRKEMFKYLTSLTNRRRVMHELYKSMNDLESFTGLVTRGLRKDGMGFIEKQLVGVSDVQVVYDKVLLSMLSLKKKGEGWLLEEDYARGDEEVLDILRESANTYKDTFNKRYRDADGRWQTRPLREWEITRAFHMGRDLSGASERRIVYGILGGVPRNADNSLKSIMHEPIARRLAPLKLIPDRFFGHRVAKRFLSMLKVEQTRKIDGSIDRFKYGYVRNGEDIGFFGVDQGDSSILDLTITDPKSNSWRARLMYLKNPRFAQELGGKKQTIGQFLDESKEAAIAKAVKDGDLPKSPEADASAKERTHYHYAKKEFLENEWSKQVATEVKSQRLFLSTLLRYPDLSDENKAAIWKNIADLNPSSIASLFPNETLEMVGNRFALEGDRNAAVSKWQEIALKLWNAERMRLYNDAGVVNTGEGSLQEVGAFFERVGLTPEEVDVVQNLQGLALGEYSPDEYAMILAKAIFPFTAFLDDAPETDWAQTSDYDFTRLLVNDHNAYQEGYGHIMGLADNPLLKPEKAAELLHEAFEKVKGPPGIEGAQRVFEPIVRTTIKIRKMKNMAKWMGASITRMLRKPTSILEEYNLQGHIADDESDTAGMLHALAQYEVVSDDPGELDELGRTQYQRIREDTDAEVKDVMLSYIRLIIQLFGQSFGMEFAKAMGLKI